MSTTQTTWVIRDYLAGRDLGTVQASSQRGALSAATRQGMWTRFRSATPLEAPAQEEEAPVAPQAPTQRPTPEPPAKHGVYAMSFPLAQPEGAHWTDCVVTQGHADYCAAWGHATHTVDGSVAHYCPRCGDTLSDSFRVEAQSHADMHAARLRALEEETAQMDAELSDAQWIDDYAPEPVSAGKALEPRDWEAYDRIPEADWSWHAVRWEAGKATAERETFPTEAERDRFTASSWGTWRAAGAPELQVARNDGFKAQARETGAIIREWLSDPVNAGVHKDADSGYFVINTFRQNARYSRNGN